MDKFDYNPIAIDEETMKYFPNVTTLHVYEKKDKYLTNGKITQYIDWRRIEMYKTKRIKQENEGKQIEFKWIVYSKEDVSEEKRRQNSKLLLILI